MTSAIPLVIDWNAIILASIAGFFTGVPAIIMAAATFRQSKLNFAKADQVHTALKETNAAINGKMDQLLAVTAASAHAAGKKEEADGAVLHNRRSTDSDVRSSPRSTIGKKSPP